MTTNPLHRAVEQAHSRYAAANPRSRAQWERACAVMPGGNTRTVLFNEPFPLRIVTGEGCHITDADARRGRLNPRGTPRSCNCWQNCAQHTVRC